MLNEITALTLASLHKVVDPPVAYSDDGTANIEENGVDAGDWVNLGENFDVKILESGGKFDVSFFMQDDLRRMVRRALYQDKPEQRGKTPPTASQWTDERMESQQRFEVPRGKLYREWTVPIVRSHMWLRQQQGVMPEVALDGRVLKLEPISGQARARAFEKVQKAERLLGSAAQFMPQEAQLVVDGAATLANIKEQLGDELVRIRTPDEIAQLQQAAMQMAQQQQQPEAA